jgi:hypothetical protein
MFASELEMSKQFERYLKENFGNCYLKEQEGLFGIPDFVLYAKQGASVFIISFELKLKNWKRAVRQAFRYKSFSNTCYVVMERKGAMSAINNIDVFRKFNIGLAVFDVSTGFEIVFQPPLDDPYSSKLNQKLVQSVAASRKRAKNLNVLISAPETSNLNVAN